MIPREDYDPTNVAYARPIIRNAIDTDRPKLFNLADQTGERYGFRQWDVVVSEACRGVLVGDFLTKTLLASPINEVEAPIRHVPIANSRDVAKGMRNRLIHGKAITKHLRELGIIHRALVVTDIVDSGKSLSRLGGYLDSVGILTDYAVLSSSHTPAKLRRIAHIPKNSDLFTNEPQPEEPETAGDTIRQGIGLDSVVGFPTPQPSKYAWVSVGEVVREQYSALANEYISSRLTELA